jgi:hypothetical protein
MAAVNAIVCDYLPPGMRAGHMSDSQRGVRRWHPSGTVVTVPAGAGRMRLAEDIEIDATPPMSSLIKGYSRLP